MATQAKVFEYSVAVDGQGRLTIPDGDDLTPPESWTPDHLLLAALVRCSIESLFFHARRAGHEATAAGDAHGRITRRDSDGRFAFVEIGVRIDARLTPPVADPSDLIAKAERDCFVGASLRVTPEYEWHVS